MELSRLLMIILSIASFDSARPEAFRLLDPTAQVHDLGE
jgi:hypothetical protein